MSRPRFSVIIPSFNRPKLLRRALRSVLDQSFSDFEIIVVDDGSDPPLDKLLGNLGDEGRVRYLRQENLGPTEARKAGISAAKGLYVCCLDDDDEFLPHHLATLYESLKRPEMAGCLVKTGIIRREAGGRESRYKLYDNQGSVLEQHWVQGDSLLSYAIPRELALAEPPSHLHAEDFNWIGRLMLRVPTWQIPEYTVVYHWHAQNRTASNPDKGVLRDRMLAVDDLYHAPGMRSRIPRELYLRNMAHQGLHWTRQCLRDRAYLLAFWGFRQSVSYFTWSAAHDFAYTVVVALRSVFVSERK